MECIEMTESLSLFGQNIPVDILRAYRNKWPEMADEKFWDAACSALELYAPPPKSLTIKNPERKWELVSAYQKTVRRGDLPLALRLVSAMCSLPGELPYFWRRICTTAAEDIGPGDDGVMNLVMACSEIYTPKKTAEWQYPILCFITEMMCMAERSRAYCAMAIIDGQIKAGVMPQGLTDDEKKLVSAIRKCNDATGWAITNAWRGEGMLKFQLIEYPLHLESNGYTAPEPMMIKGLPNYAYDMHTRVGKSVCAKLTGYAVLKDFFVKNPTLENKAVAVGWALFFEEGGKIAGELINDTLTGLEAKFIAAKVGWKLESWLALRTIIAKLLADGSVNEQRVKVANLQGY
jgi:hypothetical protein